MALRPRGAPAAAAREEEAVRATAATAAASRSASGGSGANGSDASGSGATLRAAAIAVDAPEVARACRVGSAINLAGVACGAGAAGGRGGGPCGTRRRCGAHISLSQREQWSLTTTVIQFF